MAASSGRGGVRTLTTATMTTRKRKSRPSEKTRTPASPLKVDDVVIEDLSEVFKLLADKNRLKIVLALAQEGQMHVNALCDLLGQSQPAVSHHLTLMRMVRLVSYHRKGKENHYHLTSRHIQELLEQFFAGSGNGRHALQFEDFALTFSRRQQ
jgi:ArsR family transcriptional regulator